MNIHSKFSLRDISRRDTIGGGYPIKRISSLSFCSLVVSPKHIQGKTTKHGFTLVELLIVIAILAILSVTVVVVLSPAELMKQSRDSTRLSDFANISTAMNLFNIDQPSLFMGTSSIVYVSVPDISGTCTNLGLPTLPAGWSYACSSTSTYRKVDGTGWMPIQLNVIAAGAPFGVLPIDPVNTTSSGNYYTYVASGRTYEVATPFESAKYKLGGSSDRASTDGGKYALYESGSSLTLAPIDYGDPSLVGYWTFNEGGGTAVYDYSGNNASGTWSGSGTHWVVGRIGSYAGRFSSSTSDYINVGNSAVLKAMITNITVTAWVNASNIAGGGDIVSTRQSGFGGYVFAIYPGGQPTFYADGGTYSHSGTFVSGSTTMLVNTWYLAAVTYDGQNVNFYVNGSPAGSTPSTGTWGATINPFAIGLSRATTWFSGSIDDVRVYNRAFSAAEILALYNATK